MSVCIPKEIAQSLKLAINNGEVSIKNLSQMSTDARSEVFEEYLKDADLVKKLNVGFEARMNSETAGILKKYIIREMDKVPAKSKKDLITSIDKLKNAGVLKENKPFLADLAEQKIGTKLSAEEAKTLFKREEKIKLVKSIKGQSLEKKELIKQINKLEKAITAEFNNIDAEKANDYAMKERLLTKYSDKIFSSRKDSNFDEFKDAYRLGKDKEFSSSIARFSWATWRFGTDTLGSMLKASLAMLDNGLWGRQGIKLLLSGNGGMWAENAIKTTLNIPKAFLGAGADAKNLNKWLSISRETPLYDRELIELYQSRNYITGVYQKADNFYGMDILGRGEEALPPSFLEGVAGLGRLHKASADLYNTSALRVRRLMADKWIEIAKMDGLDVMDKEIANTLGEGIGSFTGRANLGWAEPVADKLNLAAFSARLAKSTTDTYWHTIRGVTTGADDAAMRLVARQNAKVFMGISSTMLGLYTLSQAVGEEKLSVDIHPTSTTFGFVKVGNLDPVDLFGGIPAISRTVARMFTNKTFDTRLGVFVEKPWFENRADEITDFLTGKKSPLLSFYGTLLNQEHFGGDPIDVMSMVKNFIIPITWRNAIWEQGINKGDWSSALQFGLTEGLGFGIRDMKWNPSGDDWVSLKVANKKKYWEAVRELNTKMDPLIKEWRTSEEYQNMTEEERTKFAIGELTKAKKSIIDDYSDFIPEEAD